MIPVQFNGINIYPFKDCNQVIDYVEQHPSILVALNAGKLDRSTPQIKQMINNNIGYCDGVGAVLAAKKKGATCDIIPGCELWLKIIERCYKTKTFYLVGGKQEVIDCVVKKLKKDYEGINIVSYRNGYIKTDQERMDLLMDIEAKRPNVVFVAMGSPKQELLMMEMQKINPSSIYQGLGGSFDVYSGKIKRSPKIFHKLRLEGLYRAFSRFSDSKIRYRFFNDAMFILRLELGMIK
jgi:UDP-N-acetyl-D-mannosaminouronate:lipid I N-acetyl-D-mannosaminouronosyltransferase